MTVGNVNSRRVATFAVLAFVGLAGCGRRPAEINVVPNKETIYGTGRKKTLKAEVLDKKGRPLTDVRVKWDSMKPSVVTIDAEGILRSVAPGKTSVTASLPKVAPVSIPVEVFDVASITLIPNRVTLVGARGLSTRLSADVKDSKGSLLGIRPTWNVGDQKIAKVDQNGNVTSLSEGRTTITATLDDLMGSADMRILFREINTFEMSPTMIILRPGDIQKMSVTVRDVTGAVIEDAALLWSTSDPKTAVCSNGVVQAVGKGTATISAAVGNKVVTATVLVN